MRERELGEGQGAWLEPVESSIPRHRAGWRWGVRREKSAVPTHRGVLKLPERMENICHAGMLQDSMIFFSVSPSVLIFGSYCLTGALTSLMGSPFLITKRKELWILLVSGEAIYPHTLLPRT